MLYLAYLAINFNTRLILVKLTCRILLLYFRLAGLRHAFIVTISLLSITVSIFSMLNKYFILLKTKKFSSLA